MQFWSVPRGWRTRVAVAAAALIAITAAVEAQRRGPGRRFGGPRFAVAEDFDGSFQFCRVVFRTIQGGDGGDWSVDWPRADENLSIRMSELTKTPVSMDAGGNPRPLLVQLSDPVFFRCPFIMMTEVGNTYLDEAESKNLREYLLKGGFLWADDFWGEYAWDVWDSQIRKVLPSGPYPYVDLPMDHPIFHRVDGRAVPQIPSIDFWGGPWRPTLRARRTARCRTRVRSSTTAAHHGASSPTTPTSAIRSSAKATTSVYFIEFSVPGYAFGVNALIYAMTH